MLKEEKFPNLIDTTNIVNFSNHIGERGKKSLLILKFYFIFRKRKVQTLIFVFTTIDKGQTKWNLPLLKL